MITDKNIAWKTKIEYLDASRLTGSLAGVGQGAGAPTAAAHSVAASEQTAVPIGAAADELYHFWMIPYDMDITKPLRWKVILTVTSGTTTPTFTYSYQGKAIGEAMSDITSHEDTTWSGTVSGTNFICETDWVATTSQSYIASTDSAIIMRWAATYLGDAAADDLEVLCVGLEYTVNATSSDNRNHTTTEEPV